MTDWPWYDDASEGDTLILLFLVSLAGIVASLQAELHCAASVGLALLALS
jgi:hypothetical protein